MGDQPPPLPPKMRNYYTEEDQAKALEEEKLAFEKIHKEKLERSQSQRLNRSNTEKVDKKRSHTPTAFMGKFPEASYTSKTISRPVPKARNIIPNKVSDSPSINKNSENINLNKEENKNEDLMSFVSPEKTNNGLNDILKKLQDINKNSSSISSCSQYSSNRVPLTISQSMPVGMNSVYNMAVGSNLPFHPVHQIDGKSNANYSSQLSSSSEFRSLFYSMPQPTLQKNSVNIIGKESFISNPPPLPSRSPVMDISKLSVGIMQSPPGVQSPNSSNMLSSSFNTNDQVKASSSCKDISSSCYADNLSSSFQSKKIVRNSLKTPISKDLIEFDTAENSKDDPFSSVLDAFDPLKVKSEKGSDRSSVEVDHISISNEAKELLNYKTSSKAEEDELSYYEQVDPFQYMQPSISSTRSDPLVDIYDGLGNYGENSNIPPPLPPKLSHKSDANAAKSKKLAVSKTSVEKKQLSNELEKKFYAHILLKKTVSLNADKEAQAFWNQIKKLRSEYAYNDHIGNPGLLHSPCLESSYIFNLSVKLAVYFQDLDPALFTCNLNTSVEHIVMQSLVALELQGDCCDYLLKVRGVDEYLCSDTQLGEYEYVHLCIKYDKDILFTLMSFAEAKKSYIRTADDDESIQETEAKHLLTVGPTDAVYFDSLSIAIEMFESELCKLQTSGSQLLEGTPMHELSSPMRSQQLRQVVKQICALLGELETIEVSKAIELLINTCRIIQKSQGILDGEDDVPGQISILSTGSYDSSQPHEELKLKLTEALNCLGTSLNNFLHMYMGAFRVDFTVEKRKDIYEATVSLGSVQDNISVEICGLHRLDKEWHFDEYFVEVQIFHGSSCLGKPHYTALHNPQIDPKFYPKVIFSQVIDMENRLNALPRESRMVFTVFGVKKIVPENKDGAENRFIREEVGWAAIQMFSFDGFLSTGGLLLTLWPMASDKRLGPAPRSSDHPYAHVCPILSVELPDLGMAVYFPVVDPLPSNKLNFEDLDLNTQQQLQDLIERDIFTFNKSSIEEREILWEKRHYLYEEPDAFAKVLLAAHSWDLTCLPDLHSLALNWTPIPPADALHLLLPCFPDTVVRNKAVEWIRGLGSDELTTYLPQLVQAIKHEAFDVSKLTELLLERALTSPRLAHHLYWLLNQCLPLQTSMGGEREVLADARYSRRLNIVTRALMKICGANLENRLLRQEAFLRSLYETAIAIKDSKDSQRMHILHHKLRTIHENLEDSPTSLPLSPSLEVAGVDIDSCSYYTSFTVPLRLAFISSEPNTQPILTIFKVGDDLRQDMLVIQMIRLMDKLWIKEGLDLKIVTFNVVPTGDKIGILEMVRDAETLRKIQTENGLTGSFKERPIAEWLAMQNPSQLEYHRAVTNFTASCAGYCVATYILGICDRHNDNIMLKTSGHLFHIDFGKFLGDAQKFGNMKRDRTPFVLTTDMAYVINGGEKPSDKFQAFVDLCCKAFNIIRQNAHLLLYLFALMASSGIPGVTSNAVLYVEKALLQDKTNAEAGAYFARMIQESLKNWFTQVNFFIHNLAQLRFTGDSSETDSLLSFVPHTYTMSQDGRVKRVRLFSFQKRYNPFKYYVYILKVEREGQAEPSFLFRSYKEFSEFHQKLCCIFPLARIHSLPKGVQIGRSEVKAVAEKRKFDIELFLASLFSLTDEIAHSDLVYTFLHPLLRDQEDTDIHIKKLKKRENRTSTAIAVAGKMNGPFQVQGQVKVSLQYIRCQLQIVVQHARNLAQAVGSPEPSPYVKLYLLPDPNKKTKRKTKVVKKTCHPTFMEMITYRMSLEIIRAKVLEISVWSEDKFSENSYLGSAYLRLKDVNWKEETCEWLSLEHHIRTAREHILPFQS